MAAADSPVALVTGSGRGIGRAIAVALARRGLRVAVHYRQNAAAAQATAATLAGAGHGIFAADVADASQCAGLIAAVEKKFGRLDILVNNAGLYEEHDAREVDYSAWQEAWQRSLATNLAGPVHLSYLAVQLMRPQRRGRIVNLSSRGAFRGEPTAPAYGAAKAALNAFGQSLAVALATDGIGVFTVAPGWVDTDMAAPSLRGPRRAEILAQHPLGRVSTAEEIAATAAWLATDAPLALTGCIVDANGASYLRT